MYDTLPVPSPGSLGFLGFLTFMFVSTSSTQASASTSTKDKVVLLGNVDLSDDDDYEDGESDGTDDDKIDGWLENVIKTHRTPFSKPLRNKV